MATIAQDDQNTNNQNQNQPQQPPTTGGNGGAGGTGAQGGSSSSAGPAQPVSNVQQNAAPQNGQGYTDVGAYLDANQAGSQQLGNQVASNLTNTYNTTKSGIDTSANNVINQANMGYTQGNDALIQQVANNPTAAVSDPNQVAAFQAQLNDTYTGPTSWADTTDANGNTIGGYGTQQGNVANAQQEANLVNTPGGYNVLTQQVEQPGASAGVNSLDALLLGGNPNAVQTIQQAATPFNDLGTYLDAQNNTVNNTISNDTTAAQNVANNALNAFTGSNGTLTNLNNTVNNTAATDLTNAQNQYNTLMSILGGVGNDQNLQTAINAITNPSANTTQNVQNVKNAEAAENNTLTPDQLASLGITQDQWNNILSGENTLETPTFVASPFQGNGSAWTQAGQVPLTQFINGTAPTANNINASTVATPEQYAEMAAIEQLLGGQTPQGAALNPANASLAGTANLNPVSLNYNGANDYLTQLAQAQYQQALTGANATADAQQAQHQASLGGGIGGLLKNALPWIANGPLQLGKTSLKWAQNKVGK